MNHNLTEQTGFVVLVPREQSSEIFAWIWPLIVSNDVHSANTVAIDNKLYVRLLFKNEADALVLKLKYKL